MVLAGKPEGRRPLGRPRHRWEDNIRLDFREVGCGCEDWMELAQDRDRWRALVSAVINIRVPENAGNFLTSCRPVSFSRRTLLNGVSKLCKYIEVCVIVQCSCETGLRNPIVQGNVVLDRWKGVSVTAVC
jgi:hypothetical protein